MKYYRVTFENGEILIYKAEGCLYGKNTLIGCTAIINPLTGFSSTGLLGRVRLDADGNELTEISQISYTDYSVLSDCAFHIREQQLVARTLLAEMVPVA